MTAPPAHPSRLEELLADRALSGLASAETDELRGLLTSDPTDPVDEMARVVWALTRAFLPEPEPLPPSVEVRLRAAADGWITAHEKSSRLRLSSVETDAPVVTTARPTISWMPWLAAAACLALAFVAWFGRPNPNGVPTIDNVLAMSGTQTYRWSENERGVSGDVVWNNDTQRGYLRLQGLDVNDPASMQYQLWIFDGERNESFNAVDGGVFDVTASGEVLVPIDPKLEVFDPTLFAITTEAPGGVVKHVTDEAAGYGIILTAPAD